MSIMVGHDALAERKQDILDTAAQLIKLPLQGEAVETPEQAARSAAVAAVSIHWRHALKRRIEERMADILDGYEMIEGAFEDTTDATVWCLGLECAMFNGLSEGTTYPQAMAERIEGADLHEVGRLGEVADELASLWVDSNLPQDKAIGKWLAAVGIVKDDLGALASQVAPVEQSVQQEVAEQSATDTVPGVAPAQYAEWKARMESIGCVVGPLEGVPLPSEASPAAEQVGPGIVVGVIPDKAAISRAYQLLGDPSTSDPDVLVKLLGFSRSTISNYVTGRTPGKCNKIQAQVLLEDIARRQAALQEAASIFAAVV